MLFQNTEKHPHIEQIRTGVKTETRRVSDQWQMKPGGVYAVHDASKGLFQRREDAECFIRCIDRGEVKLGVMGASSAYNEGGYTVTGFREVWEELHGGFDPARVVKVYRFEYVGEEDSG